MAALAIGGGISPVAASTNVGPSGHTAVRHTAKTRVSLGLPSSFVAHALQRNDGSVLVTWGGQNGALTYNVYRSGASGTQGSLLNSQPLSSQRYEDDTAQAGTKYYYTVVASTTKNGQVSTMTSAQVANTPTGAAPTLAANHRTATPKTKVTHAKTSSRTPVKSVVKRAQTTKPHVLSGTGICDVALPDLVTASETNFGCPAGTTIIQLLRDGGDGGTDCSTLDSGGGNCDVYIGNNTHNVTETIGTGMVVYVDDVVESSPAAGDPTDTVDWLVNKGSSLIFNAAPTAPAAVKSINEEPGSTTAPADGNWGTIEYGYNGTNTQNETATAPSFGYVQDTNFSYGTDFWLRESTIPFTADVFRSMEGSGPFSTLPGFNVVEWDLSSDPAANAVGVNNVFVNGSDLIGDSSTTGEEGFFFNEFSATDGNKPDFTFSNNNVSSMANPVDAELGNDNTAGAVSGNLTVHMYGDTAQNDWGSSFFETYDQVDANGGNDSLTLDVHDNHASNNLEAGGLQDLAQDYVLDTEVYSGTGNATLAGTVQSTHLGGYTEGMFAIAQSDQSGATSTGNASISGLTLLNDNFTNGATCCFVSFNADAAFDGEAYADGAGNASASPTLQGNIFDNTVDGFDAADLYAESFFGAGNATVSPHFIGGVYHGSGDAVYQDAEISTSNAGTGTANASGAFDTTVDLISDFTNARESYVQSDLGPATDSPTFNSATLQAPGIEGGTGVYFNRDEVNGAGATVSSPADGDLTVDPTFTNSTITATEYGLYGHQFINNGSGNSSFNPSFSGGSVTGTYADVLHASLYDNGTSSTSKVQMDPSLSGTTFSSSGGYGIHEYDQANGKSSDMSPTVSASTINAFFSALHAHNNSNVLATTSPGVSGSTLYSQTGDVTDLTARSTTSAKVDPSFSGSTLNSGSNGCICFISFGGGPFLAAYGLAADATTAGDAEALPTFLADTIKGEGVDVEAHAFQANAADSVSGSAAAGGTVTNSSIQSNDFDGYYSLATQADGQGATSDPSFTGTTVSSVGPTFINLSQGSGIVSEADGWSNTTSETPTHMTDASATVSGGYVVGELAGTVAIAQDVNNEAFRLPDAGSTGPVSADAEISGAPTTAGDGVVGVAETQFIAGAVSATAGDHNSKLATNGIGDVAEADSSNGRCFSGCGTLSQVNTSATGATSAAATLTSDTPNMQVTDQGGDGAPDLAALSSADDAASTADGMVNNIASSYATPPTVDSSADNNNTSGADDSSVTVNVTNYTNDGTKGQNGIYVTNNAALTGTGHAVNSGNFDSVSIGQFLNEAGLGWFTGSGSGDTGTVSVTNSNFTGGSGWDGLDVESMNPNASPNAPLLYVMGNIVRNITGGDGVYDLGFVPEIIGNDIFGISGGGVDVQEAGVANSATLVHRTAQRPAVPELGNGTISGNFLHDSDEGIQLDSDVTLSPNVNYNDFAGPVLSNNPSGNPPGADLKVLSTNSSQTVDATNNWWGTTDPDLIAGLYSTGGAVVNVAPALASPAQSSGFTLDGWGGVHPFGGASAVPVTGYWKGWNIARGITTSPDGLGGYTLDGWGGVHPFGDITTVPTITGYWPGWDIARGIAQIPGSPTKGYTLDGWGGVHPFGGAPAVTITGYWPGWDIAKGIVVNPPSHLNTCVSGYVLDGWGGIHPFADTTSSGCSASNLPAVPSGFAYWPGWNIARGIGLQAYGQGYVVDGWGGVHPFGGAQSVTITGWWPGWDIARSIVVNPLGSGYVLDGYGGVHQFSFAPPVNISGYWLGWDIAKGIS